MSGYATAVGGRILAARHALGWTRPQLAERVCVTPQAIYRYEVGPHLPGARILGRLADALGVSADHLLGRDLGGKT